MKILISGASGMVGTELSARLERAGHSIGRLVRPGGITRADDVRWDPATGELDAAKAEGTSAVIHLAGASIGEGRWTAKRKGILRSSRVDATRQLLAGLGKLKNPPRTFLCASAIGYYGSRADEILTEASSPGHDFLAGLCRGWEEAALGAQQLGMRTAILRLGVVLSKAGGALPRMLLPFRLRLGGRLGSGRQWMSWLTLEEAGGIFEHVLQRELGGIFNAVTPAPVRNSEFTSVLARLLHRPAFFPAPAFALRAALGEMADGLLLSSQRVEPRRLIEEKYAFRQASLEEGLRSVLVER